MAHSRTTAVIGGGITGLSVAYFLAQRGYPVTLFERSSRLGGLVGSFKVGNVWLEKYFHHIFLSDTAVRKIVREVGLEREMVWRTTPMGFYGAGRICPFDGALDLLRFPVLPFLDRVRFGIHVWKTGKMHDGISLDSITAQEWVTNVWGGTIYQNFWGPLLKSKFGDAADQISAAWLWGRIYARANSRAGGKEELGYLKGGFIRYMEAMSDHVKRNGGIVRLHTEVKRVSRKEGAWSIETAEGEEKFDRVVVALPCPEILKVCPDLAPEEAIRFRNIKYQAILCMPVLMDRPLSKIYWMNVGDRSIPFTGVIEQTNFIPPSEYGGAHMTYLFNYLPPTHPWMDEAKQKVFERYEGGLRRIFPKYASEQVKQVMIFRDPYATPIYSVGYLKNMPPIKSSQDGLFFANTAHIFPNDRNMSFSVELAERVLKELAP